MVRTVARRRRSRTPRVPAVRVVHSHCAREPNWCAHVAWVLADRAVLLWTLSRLRLVTERAVCFQHLMIAVSLASTGTLVGGRGDFIWHASECHSVLRSGWGIEGGVAATDGNRLRRRQVSLLPQSQRNHRGSCGLCKRTEEHGHLRGLVDGVVRLRLRRAPEAVTEAGCRVVTHSTSAFDFRRCAGQCAALTAGLQLSDELRSTAREAWVRKLEFTLAVDVPVETVFAQLATEICERRNLDEARMMLHDFADKQLVFYDDRVAVV